MRKILTLLIRAYRYFLSPLLGNHCRFTPTCSQFAIQALAAHGVLKGSWLTLRRLACCHPWHAGGHDPVPGCEVNHHHCEVNPRHG